MIVPSLGLRRRQRSITPQVIGAVSVPRSIWPGSPANGQVSIIRLGLTRSAIAERQGGCVAGVI